MKSRTDRLYPRTRRTKLVVTNERLVIRDGEIYLTCPECKKDKLIKEFGFRQMPDGLIRNQPWCISCRG